MADCERPQAAVWPFRLGLKRLRPASCADSGRTVLCRTGAFEEANWRIVYPRLGVHSMRTLVPREEASRETGGQSAASTARPSEKRSARRSLKLWHEAARQPPDLTGRAARRRRARREPAYARARSLWARPRLVPLVRYRHQQEHCEERDGARHGATMVAVGSSFNAPAGAAIRFFVVR